MPISEQQRVERRSAIGASDMAAILGVDPWRNATDVWAEKTGRLPTRTETQVMDTGQRFEGAVLDWIAERVGPLAQNIPLSVPELHLASNLDAQVCADGRPVEAKTAGLFGPLSETWGEEGTDDIPNRVIVQVTVQMRCVKTPVSEGIVAAFLGGRGFVQFVVPWNLDLVHRIEDAALRFWKYVETDTMPPNVTPSLGTLKAMRRQPKTIALVEPHLVQNYNITKLALDAASEAHEESRARLLSALGDAEAGDAGEAGTFTYMTEKRKEHIVRASEFRMLRFKKARNV